MCYDLTYFIPSLANTTYWMNSIEPYKCSIYVRSLILSRRSSKPSSLQTTSRGKPIPDTSWITRPWNMCCDLPYFTLSLTNTTYCINFIELYECSIYVSSLILSRRSSKPNDVTAENGTTKSKLVPVSSSVNSVKLAFSRVVGLFEEIFCRTERRDSAKKEYN